jgi:hypothetical protein
VCSDSPIYLPHPHISLSIDECSLQALLALSSEVSLNIIGDMLVMS